MNEHREPTVDPAGSPADGSRMDSATETFVTHRNLLFTVAYEMLGSAADAEDVLQETWLRWTGVDLDTVREPRAYLVRITTRQALSRLRTLGRRKEAYVGPSGRVILPRRCARSVPVRGRRGAAGSRRSGRSRRRADAGTGSVRVFCP